MPEAVRLALIAANRFPNQLRKELIERRFAVTFEVTTPRPDQSLDEIEAFARGLACEPRLAAIAVTDRVRSDADRDPIDVGQMVADVSGRQPLVHWAGKDRTPADLADSLRRAEEVGLDSLLLLTGDKVRTPGSGHTPYLDAVNQVVQARAARPELLLGVAVGTFKYREEELLNQYFKLAKKARVGADFAISQIGFDHDKLRDLAGWLQLRGLSIPVMASFMPLTAGVAERVHDGRIPGIIVTHGLLQRVHEESNTPDRGHAARLRRLALQVVAAKRLGLAGAQITGIHSAPRVIELLDLTEALEQELPDGAAWQAAWDDTLRLSDGTIARTTPEGGYSWGRSLAPAVSHGERVPAQPSLGERAKHRLMDLIHRTCFEDGAPAAGLLSAASRTDLLEPLLTAAEVATKKPIAGCQTCGFCRLPKPPAASTTSRSWSSHQCRTPAAPAPGPTTSRAATRSWCGWEGPLGNLLYPVRAMAKTFRDMVNEGRDAADAILSPEDAQKKMQSDPKVLLLDMREPGDRAGSTIEGSLNIPLGMLPMRADQQLPEALREPKLQDRSTPIITTCGAGGQASLAAKVLKDMGFANVSIMEGGCAAWKNAGLPVS